MSDETVQNTEAEAVVETAPAEAEAPAPTPAPVAEEESFEVPAKFKNLITSIEEMTVLELNELVKVLEKKFGVSAAAMTAAAPAAGGEAAEEKNTFNVELTDGGAQKIQVIKVVKEVLGLGLKEAKDLVDGAPAILKEGMKKEEAEELKKKIEDAGGKVTLK